MAPPRKKTNKGIIVLSKGERIALFNLLSLIVIFLGFSIFRPMMNLSNKDKMAFHQLDSLLAIHEEAAKERQRVEAERQAKTVQTDKGDDPKDSYRKGSSSTRASKQKAAERQTYAEKASSPPSFKTASAIVPMDINKADSTALVALPQIGEVMASRIHRYRNRLGGFVSLEQLFEIKNMDSARYETVRPYLFLEEGASVNKLNVNTDEFKTLLRHPYLEYEQVKAIVSHRERKGMIQGWSQLNAIVSDLNPLLESYLTY